jgi:hypothetical protein
MPRRRLHRILRLLAARDVFAVETDGYVHNAASRLLRSDHPQSLRSFARMMGMPVIWDGFTELHKRATSGGPARDWEALLEYFAAHPESESVQSGDGREIGRRRECVSASLPTGPTLAARTA